MQRTVQSAWKETFCLQSWQTKTLNFYHHRSDKNEIAIYPETFETMSKTTQLAFFRGTVPVFLCAGVIAWTEKWCLRHIIGKKDIQKTKQSSFDAR